LLCKICNNKFNIKRGFLDLFNTKTLYICDKCYNKYKINLKEETFMLEKYYCTVISMFDKDYRINYDAFYYEYSLLFKHLCNIKNHKLLFFNYIDIDNSLSFLNNIATLYSSDIIVLVFYIKKPM